MNLRVKCGPSCEALISSVTECVVTQRDNAMWHDSSGAAATGHRHPAFMPRTETWPHQAKLISVQRRRRPAQVGADSHTISRYKWLNLSACWAEGIFITLFISSKGSFITRVMKSLQNFKTNITWGPVDINIKWIAGKSSTNASLLTFVLQKGR